MPKGHSWGNGWRNMPSADTRRANRGSARAIENAGNETVPGSYRLRRLLPNLVHEISQTQTRKPVAGIANAVGRCKRCGHVFLTSKGRYSLGADGLCTSKTACAKRMEPPKGDECYACDHRHLGKACMARHCDCKQWVYGPTE